MDPTLSISLAVSAMLGFGVADFTTKIILVKVNAIKTALVSQGIGTVFFLLGASFYFDFGLPSSTTVLLTVISGVLSGIILCSYYVALSRAKASLVAPIFACLNVVAIILSILILRETPSELQTGLIACVVVGIFLVAFKKSEDRPDRSAMVLALAAAILAGGNAILQKWIASDSHFLMGFLLTRVFMLGMMTALLLPFGDVGLVRPAVSYGKLTILGFIDMASFFAWYLGLHFGLVSIVTPIANSSPVVTVILAHVFLKERIGWHRWLGIIAILVGITVLVAVSS